MKEVQKLKLEMIRRGIISEILTRQNERNLDAEKAFRFITHANDLTSERLVDLLIEAAINDITVFDIVFND